MRVLLDACVPRGLRDKLSGHEVSTAHEMGWGDLDNGDLLAAMTGGFDVLVTVDKRLPEQQHITGRSFAVVVLRAQSNRLGDLLPLIPQLLAAIPALGAGEVREIAS